MLHKVKIIQKNWYTHNVFSLRLEKPKFFSFYAGQAIEVTLENGRFHGDLAPFTLTGLSNNDDLELIIKVYSDHNGITLAISKLNEGDSLIIGDPWDSCKNRGPGVFIAGGIGITPFIAILRQLKAENMLSESKLLFANKSEKDIFLYDELSQMLGENFINILSKENKKDFLFGRFDMSHLRKYILELDQPFYICGPDNFTAQIQILLSELGVDSKMLNMSYST